jgi:hypothetical protein
VAGKVTVREGPTYLDDLNSLNLDADDKKAVQDAVEEIVAAVTDNPNNPDKSRAGDPFPRDHHQTWKKRIALPGSNMGKRGALRLAYWWRRKERQIGLLRLYYKRDKVDLAQKEIEKAKDHFNPSSST